MKGKSCFLREHTPRISRTPHPISTPELQLYKLCDIVLVVMKAVFVSFTAYGYFLPCLLFFSRTVT